MVSSVSGSDSNYLQQLMAQMMKNMSAADTDGSAGLSKTEISSIDTGNDKGGQGFIKALTANFDKIDTDANGQVTAEELGMARPPKPPMGPPPGLSIDDMFSTSDIDGTDGLSKDELSSIETGDDKGAANFIKNLTKDFDKLDTNNDGQLSKEEIDAGKPQGPQPIDGKAESQSTSIANSGGNEDSSSSFEDKLGSLKDYFVKQLLSAYEKSESSFASSIKSGMASNLASSLTSALDVAI